ARYELRPLLVLRPVPQEGFAHESVAHGRDYARARIAPGQFLDRDRVAYGVEAGSSVLLGDEDPEESQLAHLLGPGVREVLALVEGARFGDDLLFRERADGLSRDFLRFRESEVHRLGRRSSRRIKSPRSEP